MAIDNFGKYEPDPKEQKAWEALRTRAFFAAAAEKLGDLGESNILEAHDGNINAAVDALGIDAEFKAKVKEALENKRVNEAMDKADAQDRDDEFYDLDIVIGPYMTRT